MRKPRIIFFDIDGTLIDMEKKRITKPTLDALRRLQQSGILLAIATGRSPLIVPRFDGVEFDVFLTYNGSYCYDRRGDIFASPIPPQDVQTLIQNAAALGRPVSVAGRTQLLSNGTDDDLTAYYAFGGREPVISDQFEEASKGEVFQLLMGCRKQDWPAILKGHHRRKDRRVVGQGRRHHPHLGRQGRRHPEGTGPLRPDKGRCHGLRRWEQRYRNVSGRRPQCGHGQRLPRPESHRQRGLSSLC